jgi:outer membrane protein assembly factor BamB
MRYRIEILSLLLLFAAASLPVSGQSLRWTFETGGKVYSSPALADGLLVFGSGDGNVYAVDAETGAERWRFETEGAVHSSPLVADGSVYVVSHDGNLYALDAGDGSRRWSFATGGEKVFDLWDYYLSSPAVAGPNVVFGSGDGRVYAVDRASGAEVWHFQTGDVVHAEPTVADGVVFVGSFDGFFYALGARDGELVWKFDTVGDTYFPRGAVQRGALVHEGIVYFGSRDYNVYALDQAAGTGRWNMKERGSWVIARPTFLDGRVYMGTSDSHAFMALDAQSGVEAWRKSLSLRVYGSAAAEDGVLYFGSHNGTLYAVDPAGGEELWTFRTPSSRENHDRVFGSDGGWAEGFELYGADFQQAEETILSLGSILSTPLVAGGSVYFGSADGRLYAVGLPQG